MAFEKDPAYPFLAIDKKKLLEEAPPYDPKTSCWCPEEKHAFQRANIIATKGDDITVKTEGGQVSDLQITTNHTSADCFVPKLTSSICHCSQLY